MERKGYTDPSYFDRVRSHNSDLREKSGTDEAFDEPEEDFTLIMNLAGLSRGEHKVEAYAMDGKGNTEISPAIDIIFIEPRTYAVFLPLLMTGR
jgi:hypothetical protein